MNLFVTFICKIKIRVLIISIPNNNMQYSGKSLYPEILEFKGTGNDEKQRQQQPTLFLQPMRSSYV